MFENVIDKKDIITINDEEIVDLTKSCFKSKKSDNLTYTIKKVPYSMIMRMDLISYAQYGTDEYTDLLLKYNDISNPFTLNYNDIIFIPSLESITNDLDVISIDSTEDDANLVRNYHKYIDKNKIPNTIGSQKNDVKIDKNYTEANITEEDSSPIILRNGRIYFGTNSNVECSVDGITASDFAIQKLKNDL